MWETIQVAAAVHLRSQRAHAKGRFLLSRELVMCYSAKVRADYKSFMREYGARLSIKEFYELFWRRVGDPKIDVLKSAEAIFSTPQTDEERKIHELISSHAARRLIELREDLQKQTARLATAETKLLKKVTKAAANEKRIALKKIPWLRGQISNLTRTHQLADDSRFFPGEFVPVMLMQDDERVLKPMRFRLRPPQVSPSFDTEFEGTYNARRNKLKGFWRELYQRNRAVVVLTDFYEHVPLHLAQGRDLGPGELVKDAVVEFQPKPEQFLYAACLWAHWKGDGHPDLLSFALITDEPPDEVRAAGHDRCIIPLRREDIDAWLDPAQHDLDLLDKILDNRVRPFFHHAIVPGPELPAQDAEVKPEMPPVQPSLF